MLYLTGGILNPFSLLLIGPAVLAAASLPVRHVVAICLLAILACTALAVHAMPLPAPQAEPFDPPLTNRIGAVTARILGIAFCAGYAWQAAREAARMELALDTAHTVLAREQRLSALGALAAAAAELVGEDKVARDKPPAMASEDFSFMLERVPAAYINLGIGNGAEVHNPRYQFNDEAIPYGAALYARVVEKGLPGG
jgi:two-component system sensor histidine kinase RegB